MPRDTESEMIECLNLDKAEGIQYTLAEFNKLVKSIPQDQILSLCLHIRRKDMDGYTFIAGGEEDIREMALTISEEFSCCLSDVSKTELQEKHKSRH